MESLIQAFFGVTDTLLDVLVLALIVRALLSWVRPDPSHILVRTLMRITDPILVPIMKVIPNFGGIDVSPIVAIIGIQLVQKYVLHQLAMNLLSLGY